MEQLRNTAVSTLNGTIDDVQMSILVQSNLSFPPSGNFTIIVDSELMLVTAVAGNNFTVQRGSEGSAAASHLSGVNVTNILSNRSLTELIKDIAGASSVGITSGPISALPAPGTNGTLYLPTDSPVLLRDNGTAFVPFGPLHPLKPVPLSGWSSFGFNGSGGQTTLTQDAGGTIFLSDSGASSEHHRLYARGLPARPFNITIAFLPVIPYVAGTFPSTGLMLMNQSSDKRQAITFGSTSGTATQDVYSWTDGNSSASSHDACQSLMTQFGPIYYRVSENGNNRTWSYSIDGINFFQFLQQPANTGFAADKVGIYVDTVNAAVAAMTLLSYEEKP